MESGGSSRASKGPLLKGEQYLGGGGSEVVNTLWKNENLRNFWTEGIYGP